MRLASGNFDGHYGLTAATTEKYSKRLADGDDDADADAVCFVVTGNWSPKPP